jgi:hypothetical protein
MGEKKKRRQNSGIPYPAKDPRYHRVWDLVNRQGKTLEDAIKIAETGGTTPPREAVQAKKAGKNRGAKNGAVNADDILNHPDTPEEMKKKIREAQGDQVVPDHERPATAEKIGPGDNKVTVPLTGTLDLTQIMATAGKIPQQAMEPASLETIERLLNDIAGSTATIAQQLTRIADKQTGISVTSTTPPAPDPQPARSPPTPSPPPERMTDNGLTVGCDAIWKGRKGKVTRIMPGKREIEVKFLDGRKTLLADQVELAEAVG